jgi:hypothetical protein
MENDGGTKLAFKNSFAPRLFLVKKMEEISRKRRVFICGFFMRMLLRLLKAANPTKHAAIAASPP